MTKNIANTRSSIQPSNLSLQTYSTFPSSNINLKQPTKSTISNHQHPQQPNTNVKKIPFKIINHLHELLKNQKHPISPPPPFYSKHETKTRPNPTVKILRLHHLQHHLEHSRWSGQPSPFSHRQHYYMQSLWLSIRHQKSNGSFPQPISQMPSFQHVSSTSHHHSQMYQM